MFSSKKRIAFLVATALAMHYAVDRLDFDALLRIGSVTVGLVALDWLLSKIRP